MKSIYKMLLIGALPIALNEIGTTIASAIDSSVLGKLLGETQLAASGVCSPIFSFSAMIGLSCCAGLEAVCFKKIGLGKKKEARQIFSNIFIILTFLAILISVIMLLFHKQIVYLLSGFSNDDWLLTYSDQYYLGVMIGLVFNVLRYILFPATILNNKTKLLTLVIIISAVVNASFDIIFTVVFNMGVFGVGLATTLSHISMCIILLPQILSKNNTIYISFTKININEVFNIIKNGLPVGIKQASNIFCKIAMTYILLYFTASTSLAAYSATASIKYLLISFPNGLGCSVLILLSYYIGEKNIRSFKQLYSASIKTIIFAILPFAIVIALSSPAIALLFANFGSALYNQILLFLICFCCSLPFYAYTTVKQNYFQAVEKLSFSNIVCFLQRFAVFLLVNLVFSISFGVIGSAIGVVVSEIICAAICKIYSHYIIDKRQHVEKLTKVENVWFYTITNKDDLTKAIFKSEQFLLKNNFVSPETLKIRLFIEESTTHIINNGFKEGENNYIQFRLVLDGNELTINLKDNCKKFKLNDSKSQIISNFDENTAGIRFIILSASKVNLIELLGINCVMIKYKKQLT